MPKGAGGKSSQPRDKARRKRQIEVRAAPDGSELCLQCGLCCDGTLFAHIDIKEGELEYAESLGLEVEVGENGEVSGAPEPCTAFLDGCCSLYRVGRPQACGEYRCELLNQYVARSRSLDDALGVVQLVRTLSREIEVEMQVPLGAYNRRAVLRYLNDVDPSNTPTDHGRFLVAFHRLNLLGERYFRYDSKPRETEASDAGARVVAEETGVAVAQSR
jgi:hypothetical protein